jgi:type II secretory pathway predicted ATPase ExeA
VSPPWQLAIRIPALTRSETARYLDEKLAAAGRPETVFTPRALSRLYDISGGIPRGIDRLGSLALMAGAARGLEMITPEVVTGVAAECSTPLGRAV